jgi:glutamine synthetase
LAEACDELEKDDVLAEALGAHVMQQFLAAKRAEWSEYNQQVTSWEQTQYLARY